MENDGKVDKEATIYTHIHTNVFDITAHRKNIEEAKRSWSIGAKNVIHYKTIII